MIRLVLIATLLSEGPPAGDGRISMADLPAYHAALEDTHQAALPVTFRDLWSRSESYRGRRVRIEGRAVRRFAQAPFESFPALTELWVVTTDGNPLCLVYPNSGKDRVDRVEIGATVVFEGTFLRKLTYDGGDGPRLAPLIVSGRPPLVRKSREQPRESNGPVPTWIFWTLGLAVMSILGLLLAWFHVRPWTQRRPTREPHPRFLDDDIDSVRSGTE